MGDNESTTLACDNAVASENFVPRKRETRAIIEITEAHYRWLCENNRVASNGNVYDGNNNLIAWKHGNGYWGMK